MTGRLKSNPSPGNLICGNGGSVKWEDCRRGGLEELDGSACWPQGDWLR